MTIKKRKILPNKNVSIKKINISKISTWIMYLFVAISVLVVAKTTIENLRKEKNISRSSTKSTVQALPKEKFPGWVTYKNREYGFTFKIPSFLSKEEIRNQAQYERFIKLTKSRSSMGDSVFIGITKLTFDEEVDKIKGNIQSQSNQLPETEVSLIVSGRTAKVMYYKSVEMFEERGVFVVSGDGITISISSTPTQIETIMETFVFLN